MATSRGASQQHQVLVPFRVRVPTQLIECGGTGVRCYIVGSCPHLGDWNVEQAKPMPLARSGPDWIEFGRDAQIPLRVGEVSYRFFLARCHNPNDEDSEVTLCLSYWESFRCPRRLALMDCLTGRVEPDVAVPEFGCDGAADGQKRIQRGWLTGQTQVHLHLMPGSVDWFRPNYRRALGRGALVSCWSLSLADGASAAGYVESGSSSLGAAAAAATTGSTSTSNSNGIGGGSGSGTGGSASLHMADLEESLNGDEYLSGRWPAMVCSIGDDPAAAAEAAAAGAPGVGNESECETRVQTGPGQMCTPDCHIVFQVDTFDLESTAFAFELRDPTSNQQVGSAHLMPLRSQESKGVKILQLVANKQGGAALVGTMKLHYLVINSMAPHLRNDLALSYRRYWVKRKTMDVGHRGAGNSHRKNPAINTVRENTIHSMNLAAQHGADFVEFDVQFSRDNVPVVFHDFNVAVTMRLKQRKLKQVEVPVKNFTMESLQSMKLCALSEMTENDEHLDTDDIDPVELQPFPSLRQCLEQVNADTGFLIELKYPQKVKGSQLEENVEHYCERNYYVNRILKDVIECGGRRRIVLCSFDADCCTMLQLKQNRYPVLFLTQGRSEVYPPYEDPRCNSTLASMRHALSLGLLGLSANVEEFLKDDSLVSRVQATGLVLFLWGDGLNESEAKSRFRKLGADALIYDYIHTEKPLGSRTVFEPAADPQDDAAGVGGGSSSALAVATAGLLDSSRSSSSSPPQRLPLLQPQQQQQQPQQQQPPSECSSDAAAASSQI